LRYNYLSLLNLPEVIQEFGSARNYFEGKFLGERYVQEVKNTRKGLPTTNLAFTLLRKLHEGKALEAMVETRSDVLKTFRATDAGDTNKRRLNGCVRVYRNEETARLAFYSYQPISLVKCTNDVFGILYYHNGCNRGEIRMLKLLHLDNESTVRHGLRYWVWEISTETTLIFADLETEDYVVLLPKFGGEVLSKEYTMVTKEWSPAMLDHYEYSKAGIETKPKYELVNTSVSV
jgi:hypothetical protein